MRLRITMLTLVLIAAYAGYAFAACDNKKHSSTTAFAGNGTHIMCNGDPCPEHGTETRVFSCDPQPGWNCRTDSFAWRTRYKDYVCEDNKCKVRYTSTAWGGKTSFECSSGS